MNLQTLRSRIGKGELDTVIVAAPDVFGRLVGKRFAGKFFLDNVVRHGTHGCNYLLTVNMEMEPQEGFVLANWEKGFGDFELRPDLSTLRALPWQLGTAMVLCDYRHADGSLVEEAPRSTLRRQIDALSRRKLTLYTASELEFFLFNETFEAAFSANYCGLTPSSNYRIDYHTMQPARDETIFRACPSNRARVNGAGDSTR
jgi:glutamine synthetase